MIKIVRKRENERLLIGIVIDTHSAKKRINSINQRIKLVRLGFRVIFAKPENIHFEEKENTFSFYFSQQGKLPLTPEKREVKRNVFGLRKRIKRIFNKEKMIKGAATLTIFALVFQFASIIPSHKNTALAVTDSMCSFATDVILAIDVTQSMDEGAQPSRCEWTELRMVPGEDYSTWYLNKKYNVTEEWCQSVRDSYDETIINFSPQDTIYYPSVPSKLEAVKQAAQNFVDRLKSEDQSGVISFSGNVNLEKSLSSDHTSTKNIIANLSTRSGTNTSIADAIDEAIEEFSSEGARIYALHTLILLSDGSDSKSDLLNQKIQEAAALGIRIFTIGLGANANQGQLQQIAQGTGGNYHFASSQSELDDIYSQIASEICGFGDQCEQIRTPGDCVADGQREIEIEWNFPFCGDDPEPQNVLDDDCACVYSEWEDGDCVGDGIREQTRTAISEFEYCQDLSRTIDDPDCAQEGEGEEEGEEEEGEVFGSISGHKYNDLNKDSQYNEGEPGLFGWTILLEKNNNENWEIFSQTTTDDQGYYIFENLEPATYRVSEVMPEGSNWEQTYPEENYWEVSLKEGDNIGDLDFLNYQPICGNGILDEDEACDDGNLEDGDGCSSVCQIEEQQAGGGQEEEGEQDEDEEEGQEEEEQEEEEQGEEDQGGGAVLPPLLISGAGGGTMSGGAQTGGTGGSTPAEEPLGIIEGSIEINQTQVQNGEYYDVVIAWETSHPASSQVIYAKEGEEHNFDPNDNQGNPPKYGYAHTTPEYDTNPKVISHSVTLSGLEPGATYYFRCVSRGSFIVSEEQTFTVENPEAEKRVQQIVEMQKDLAKIEAQLTLISYEVEKMAPKEEIQEEEKPEEEIKSEEIQETPQKAEEATVSTGQIAQTEKKSLLAAVGLLSQGTRIAIFILIILAALALYYLVYYRKKKKRG